ncbi:hypothetical protein AcdelDRAFT_3124 [Acidovorax delafieldii 2AN]|uniref:Uncharacterized protein n=1 Tax=Acidovorax delafieldii 2AN TaxID=573060 RepID=C5T894_ACIDE|nr:hypothetical protein [Acidovorax delafieldii]EER59296.1 hypothetical protein AcdelDRAFT_3124 [Acidovorax delafieldii 2AN]
MKNFPAISPAVHLSSRCRTAGSSAFFSFLQKTNQLGGRAEPATASTTAFAEIPPAITWLTVAQMAVKHPAWSENSLRALIFASKDRVAAVRKGTQNIIPGNGLAAAIRRVGRRVLINEKEFLDWVDQQGIKERQARG